ncbi:MAG TPA: type II toxin-antitoxin system YafQ family toxin [Candidatus Paceibacterota bacterium]|nr:type II toxin-antitoxin system YafQ family toxin [Candidatus Paceibacterota bacterium]
MYELRFTHLAKKSLKKLGRSGSFDAKELEALLGYLIQGSALPARYKDHQLKGKLSAFRECHLGFDLLVKYERDESLKMVVIADFGTHSDLF